MSKYIRILSTGLLAAFIGVVLAVQMGSTAGADQGGLVPYSKVKDYEVALNEARLEKEEALKELEAAEARLAIIENEMAQDDEVIEAMLTETEKYKLLTGAVDVHGPGIIMTIKDPIVTDEFMDDMSVITYHYEELLSLVNKLKEAGAEAISINEHRIIQTTEISLAGKNININGKATAPPYYVKAIGDPTTMTNALTIRSGIVETLKKNYNLIVEIEMVEDVAIPRYDGVITLRYAEPIGAEDKE
ncbi:MAG: DUF881 domain-containing protein [Firmicutes bacterium]|nr:DUF881 domain-containing protein [Bacillota bacterium]MBQ3122984.1 DUF881 domain-containing protein [Bacillota bacterium]